MPQKQREACCAAPATTLTKSPLMPAQTVTSNLQAGNTGKPIILLN